MKSTANPRLSGCLEERKKGPWDDTRSGSATSWPRVAVDQELLRLRPLAPEPIQDELLLRERVADWASRHALSLGEIE